MSQSTAGIEKEARVLAQLSLGKILFVLVLIVGAWILLKWLRRFFSRFERGNPRLRFLLRQVEPPLRIAVWFGALLLGAEILAPSKDAFLAALGSAALAIGLGLQDLIKNLIGGMVIVADRPFQTGDRVRFGEAYGEVAQIGLRSTKILTDSGTLVTVPNSDALTSLTFNSNQGVAESKVMAEVALPHGTDPDVAVETGREVAVACPYTHLGHPISVDLDDSPQLRHMKLVIGAYVYDHRYEADMKTDLLRRAKREFLANGLLRRGGE